MRFDHDDSIMLHDLVPYCATHLGDVHDLTPDHDSLPVVFMILFPGVSIKLQMWF